MKEKWNKCDSPSAAIHKAPSCWRKDACSCQYKAALMEVIEEYAGVLPFNDKASPEVIFREVQMSKNAFKRAVGRLYKERRIEITDKSIRKL